VWRIASADEESLLDPTLPMDRNNKSSSSQAASTAQPWLVHSLPVNALNFCAFSLCFVRESTAPVAQGTRQEKESKPKVDSSHRDSVYFAVPNALNSGAIDIFHLPSEKRVSTISADPSIQTGMVMAVNIFITSQKDLYVVSGYEDGHVMVHARRSSDNSASSTHWKWERLYASRPHVQPVLSLDIVLPVASGKDSYYFFTSSADALLVRHPVPPVNSLSTTIDVKAPLQVLNTKHAGQQALRVRSDNKIFATAGWDARVRVYSCKTMKELAVLKWHKEGCYAIAFAGISSHQGEENKDNNVDIPTSSTIEEGEDKSDTFGLVPPVKASLKAVQQQRSQKAQETHWLAAGSKDGKISLWDIY
jgi:WD40 repeat protein